jgi:glycosyltransferase involved in cell wall biosynthesis
MMPDVSVVVPTHNRSRLLGLTLASVLRQRGVGLEVIVVDDGSTDDTVDTLKRIRDPRVRTVRHETALGVSAARNRGVSEATGRWVAFLDDDDLWAPDKLSVQLRAAEDARSRWVYAGAVNITIDHRILGGAPPEPPEVIAARLRGANLIPGGCSGVIVERDALPPEGTFDGTYRHFADWDLWIRLLLNGPPAWVPRALVGYRIHPGNASLDTEGMVAELDVIERRYGGPVDRLRFYRHVARVSLRAGWRRQALRYYLRAAMLGDPKYLFGDFISDLGGIGRAVVVADSARKASAHNGYRRPAPHRLWMREARAWLDDFMAELDL